MGSAVWALSWAAVAHQPHDPVDLLAVSPGFATDGFVIASRYPNQNWRSLELAASTDGGARWAQAIRGLGNEAPMSSVSLSPAFPDDRVALVTTRGEGAWVSTDGAATWHPANLPGRDLSFGVVTHDGTSPVLVVSEVGGGLSRSTDLGATWVPVAGGAVGVTGLAAYGSAVVLRAGRRVAWSTDAGLTFDGAMLPDPVDDVAVGEGLVAAGTASGLYVSEAGGPFVRLDAFPDAVTCVGVSPGGPGDRALFATQADDGVFVSTDGGATVERHATDVERSPQTTDHFTAFAFSGDYAADGTVFLSTFEGLLWSTDAGHTWAEADTRPPGVVNALALSPSYATDRTLVVASYDAGVWVSDDGGASFGVRNDDLRISSAYDVALAPREGGGVTALLALNAQVYWGVDPFAGWTYTPLPAEADYTSRAALSPGLASDGVVLVGTRANGIWRTADRGRSWARVTEPTSAISALVYGPDGRTVMAGNKAGQLFVSPDGGRSFALLPSAPRAPEPAWIDAGPDGFLVGTGIGLYTTRDGSRFTAVPEVPGVVHQVAVAADGTRFAAVRGGALFRSDPGEAFVPVAEALSAIGTPGDLAISPTFATDHTLFAAIDERLFRSTDRADHFVQVGMTPIRYEEDAQAFHPRNLSITRPLASVRAVMVLRTSDDVTLRFSGTGFAVLGVTREDLGSADVELDGEIVGAIHQAGPEAWQVEQFRREGLTDGPHVLRLLPTTNEPVELDAVDVFRPMPEPPTPPDTGATDTGSPSSTGTRPTTPTDGRGPDDASEGCGCDAATTGGGAVWLAALGGVAVRRRRRVARG